jgi:hypothetical protein
MQQDRDSYGGGLGEKQMEPAVGQDPLSGTGGSAGGGTRAGEGEPSGGVTDDTEFSNEHPLASPGELAGTADQAIAREIEALGPVDGSLADAASGDAGGAGSTTMGDAIGSAAGIDVGEGTPGDKGDLGGGGASLGQSSGTGPAGSGSPGGDNRQ